MNCHVTHTQKKTISLLMLDDNSNQSSIADSSPVKQENSCSTSPAPEPTIISHRDNGEVKNDQSPDSKRGQSNACTHNTHVSLGEQSQVKTVLNYVGYVSAAVSHRK